MSRILVTGASGFIGQALIKELYKASGDQIYAVISGRRPSVFPVGVRVQIADLRDPDQRETLIKTVRPDVMIHLAWSLENKNFLESEDNLSWLGISIHLMELFAAAGGRRFVFSGSSAEYGYAQAICRENSLAAPEDLYGVCKYSFTNIACEYFGKRDIEFASARVFSVYGQGEANTLHSVPKAIKCLSGSEPFLCKAPNNRWDYIHIADVAKALAAIAYTHYCGIVNVSTNLPVDMRTVFGTIARELGKEALLSFDDANSEQRVLVGDNTVLKNVIGYGDFIPLSEGLRQTVEWWLKGCPAG